MAIIYHRFAVRLTTQVTIIIYFRHPNWKTAVGLINLRFKFQLKGLKITLYIHESS